MKAVRDEESNLTPRRNIRDGITQQINRIKSDGQKGTAVDQKISELENQLRKAKSEDEDVEKQFEILKRKSVKESEEVKWTAVREYAEKLILLADASSSFLDALPSVPPSADNPYNGAKSTAATRASVQASLNKWVTGHVKVPEVNIGRDTNETDTRSFGETHASELSGIEIPGQMSSVPASGALNSSSSPVPHTPENRPIDPSQLNQTPVQVFSQGDVGVVTPLHTSTAPASSNQPVPMTSPTVAETGIPLTGGSTGPGPRKGSLSQHRETPPYGSSTLSTSAYVPAEDEKMRLAREERDRILSTGSSSTSPAYESAEDEKKRLERAERERVLRLAGSGNGSGSGPKGGSGTLDDSVPPPYQD